VTQTSPPLTALQAHLQAFKVLAQDAERDLTAREWEVLREILVIQFGSDEALASRKATPSTP
jgi:hypothetical protein